MVDQIERHRIISAGTRLRSWGTRGSAGGLGAVFAGVKRHVSGALADGTCRKYGKTPAQVILKWDIQDGIAVIPKSTHKERMMENADIWDFELDAEDMRKIRTLDTDEALDA